MAKLVKVLVFGLVLLLFSSCAEEYVLGTCIEIPPEDRNIHQLITREYTDVELEDLTNSRFSNIEDLNEKYPIECIRTASPKKTFSGEKVQDYYVTYCGENKYVALVLRYVDDQLSCISVDQVVYDARYNLAWYEEKLKPGTPLQVVETEIDPYGRYPIHYMGTNSTHCTSDGYAIKVTYDYRSGPADAVIKSVEITLI